MPKFRKAWGILAVSLALGGLALVPSAYAQTQRSTAPGPTSGASASSTITDQRGPGMPPLDAHQTTRGTSNHHEVFRVLGMSGVIAAPVTPAYNGDATYTTFAGQPGNGMTAVLAQSIDGAP